MIVLATGFDCSYRPRIPISKFTLSPSFSAAHFRCPHSRKEQPKPPRRMGKQAHELPEHRPRAFFPELLLRQRTQFRSGIGITPRAL